jgi:hypothetical protein
MDNGNDDHEEGWPYERMPGSQFFARPSSSRTSTYLRSSDTMIHALMKDIAVPMFAGMLKGNAFISMVASQCSN